MLLVVVGLAAGCGSAGSAAATSTASTSTVSKEQRAFDRVAKGHATTVILKRVDRAIAQAGADPTRPARWSSAFRQAIAAAQSGDGYDASVGKATNSGRSMLRAALPLWDRYVRLHPRTLDDAAFRALLTAFSDNGLRNLAGLRPRLRAIAPLLTGEERLVVSRNFPSLADAVATPSSPETATPEQFLTPAPTVRFVTEDGFKFSLRLVGSKKLIRYPDDSVDTAPGRVLIALRLEVTNETPGRRTYLPIDTSSIELGVRDTRCHVKPWKGLCSNYMLTGYGDDAGTVTGQVGGGQQELAPGVPFTFWVVSEELRDRPARDFTIDIHTFGRLTYTTPPATPGEPKADVRRLNIDGPPLRPCGDQC